MAVIYRPDYAKFVLDLPRGLFRHYYDGLREAAAKRQYTGEWDKHHHVQAMHSMEADRERTIIEIWGEWTAVIKHLPFDVWGPALKRFDVRGIQWDADGDSVLTVGQSLQRAGLSYNVEVFNSKNASKRLGRDRGGQGFRVGSRKSDLCLVVYKRAQEPVAIEYRIQSHLLRRALEMTESLWRSDDRVFDRWERLTEYVAAWGSRRLTTAMELAGFGVYWPTSEQINASDVKIAQKSFAAQIESVEAAPITELSEEEYSALMRDIERGRSV
jgi:hypothetical protein